MAMFDRQQRAAEPVHPTPKSTQQAYPLASRLKPGIANGGSNHSGPIEPLRVPPWKRSLLEIPLLPRQQPSAAWQPMQGKAEMSETADPFEREADRIAESVIAGTTSGSPVQVQGIGASRGAEVQRQGGGEMARASSPPAHDLQRSSGQPLAPETRSFMEGRFGSDFGDVRVHTDQAAFASARVLRAAAYTIGSDIGFAPGKYQPGTTDGLRLLGHELTHVVQQRQGAGPVLMRKPDEGSSPAADPEPDYKALAHEIHEAISIFGGTDEERVYRALIPLNKDLKRIGKLMAAYAREFHGASLIDDIEWDFSGGEEEYALQLLGRGRGLFDQRVQAAPSTASGYLADARRLYEAGPGMVLGTDEEAIFAVLTPLANKSGMRTLEQTYDAQRYGLTLREMLVDELSGSELSYALELLGQPGEKNEEQDGKELGEGDPRISEWIREAYDLIEKKETGFGSWFDRRKDGSARWNEAHWEFKDEKEYLEAGPNDQKNLNPTLTLRPGVDAYDAVKSIFTEQYKWDMDCGQFVEIARLYVQWKLIPHKKLFNEWAEKNLKLSTHAPREYRHALFIRAERDGVPNDDVWKTEGRHDTLSEESMLASAPIGARVRWTSTWTEQAADYAQIIQKSLGKPANSYGWFAFQNENAIKIGPDRYAAYSLRIGSAKEIADEMIESAENAVKDMTALSGGREDAPQWPEPIREALEPYVFVDQIEIFRWDE